MGSVEQTHYDVFIVGAGFGGMYQLHESLKLGLTAKLIDSASGVGGTWFHNKYPGCMSDTESYVYRYSWDKEDLVTYPWSHHYLQQPEILKYLNHVADKHGWRKNIQLNTELLSANFDEDHNIWHIQVSTGEVYTARYFVTALGLLSKINYPDIKGIDVFQGEKYHTGRFPASYDFSNKTVAVIGCGSTGVQVVTELGKPGNAKKLVSFQRHPQYTVPSGDGPVSKEYRDKVNETYDEIWDGVWNSRMGFGFQETTRPCFSVSAEEREKIYQNVWDRGGGFRFMFDTFCDLATSVEANNTATDFVRSKIAQIVKDPEKRRKLTPHDYYARRPLCDAGYYNTFNNDNVDIVDLRDTPIQEITKHGILTSDGTEHKFDVIIFATGFDAVDGNYMRINIRGRNGESLKDHWKRGPSTYLGISVASFPNLFMIMGPNSPFTNITPSIETHVQFITKTLKHAEEVKPGAAVVEITQAAEDGWTRDCEALSGGTLFSKNNSWIFGANIPGKKQGIQFYLGGLQVYREKLDDITNGGWIGYKPIE